MVVGTDISELLLQNKTEFPYETTLNTNKSEISVAPQISGKNSTASRRNSIDSRQSKDNNRSPPSDDDGTTAIESLIDDNDRKSSLTEIEITDKFRNYLLYGSVSEALEWATDNNLWGHALFLASKVDRRSHANVLMKFANKLELNDPLQTLYQLMSGRSPSSVTSVQDEKWGDWRPHLAMILANTSQKPELDRKSITTLGDSLYNRGDLFAAQFCYLMAQVGFGKYSNVNTESMLMSNSSTAIRLVLLGANHHQKCFKDFATNEAIIMTEIYEYACALNDDKFSIVDFQPFKYLLATRMLDYGMQLKALMYLEQLAMHIQRMPSKYDAPFIEKIYRLADQLKYFDPVLDRLADDLTSDDNLGGASTMEDQQWLQQLSTTLKQFNVSMCGLLQLECFCNIFFLLQVDTICPVPEIKNQIDQQFDHINQQFSELNLQYNSNNYTAPTNLQAQSSYQQDNQQSQQDYSNVTQSLPYMPTATNIGEPQPYYSGNYYDPTQQQQISTDTNVSTIDGYYQDNNSTVQQQQSADQQQYSNEQYGSYDHWNQYQQSQTNDQV